MPIRMNKNSKVSFVAYGIRMCEVGWKALYGIKEGNLVTSYALSMNPKYS